MSADPTNAVQERLTNYVKLHAGTSPHIGVVAGIISPDVPNGQTLLYAGGDLWNTQQQSLTLDGDTLFEIGSITKVFTSLGWYLKHQDYTGTLGEFITAVTLPTSLSDITIMDLASYGPGFPTDNRGGWWGPSVTNSLTNLLNFLKNSQGLPQYPAGSCYSYSNFGWGLLALATSGVSSYSENVLQDWTALITALTTDLNMSGNTAPYNSSMNSALPVGYDITWTMLPLNHNYAPTSLMLMGAGYLVSTGNDMMIWLNFNMGNPNPNLPVLQLQQGTTSTRNQCSGPNPDGPEVSLGWFVHHEVINGEQITYLAKDGGVAGFTSWMGFQDWVGTGQASPLGCFVLTNSHGASSLGTYIINILLGNPSPVEVPVETNYVTPPAAEE